MSSRVIALLSASVGAELCTEGALEDGTSKVCVVTILIIGRIDSIVAIRLSGTVARHLSDCVAQVSVRTSDGDHKLFPRLANVHSIPGGHRATPQDASDSRGAGRVQTIASGVDCWVALKVKVVGNATVHSVTDGRASIGVVSLQGREAKIAIAGTDCQPPDWDGTPRWTHAPLDAWRLENCCV